MPIEHSLHIFMYIICRFIHSIDAILRDRLHTGLLFRGNQPFFSCINVFLLNVFIPLWLSSRLFCALCDSFEENYGSRNLNFCPFPLRMREKNIFLINESIMLVSIVLEYCFREEEVLIITLPLHLDLTYK